MAIDTSALSYLNNALSQINGTKVQTNSNSTDMLSVINNASGLAATENRYKAAFEEKMKLANGSDDVVEISADSLKALQNYVQGEKASGSTETQYTYDYATIRKQRLANQAAMEQEIAEKYGHKETATPTAEETAAQQSATPAEPGTAAAEQEEQVA
ncbi:MAG: hypothetical protein IJ228_08115 [Succinivibrio sp.]|nr:hypothetical protein [Succinivibrio sp.]